MGGGMSPSKSFPGRRVSTPGTGWVQGLSDPSLSPGRPCPGLHHLDPDRKSDDPKGGMLGLLNRGLFDGTSVPEVCVSLRRKGVRTTIDVYRLASAPCSGRPYTDLNGVFQGGSLCPEHLS